MPHITLKKENSVFSSNFCHSFSVHVEMASFKKTQTGLRAQLSTEVVNKGTPKNRF